MWILDGDTHHTGLLKFALNEKNFEHTLVVLVVSMATPWNVMDSLKRWTGALRDHCELLRISADQMKEYEQSCEYDHRITGPVLYHTAVEPGFVIMDFCGPDVHYNDSPL